MLSKFIDGIALRCVEVAKTFMVQRDLRVWRILFGLDQAKGLRVEALHNISLEVPRGKIIGILGRNGAGKSTLLRLLGGVYSPTRGRIEIFGQIAGLFELGGMGSQFLTGQQYAVRYLQFMGASKQDINKLIHEVAEFSELGEAFNRQIRTYSSGMSARLYFAVATAIQHEIYLIDELLSVGDEHFQAKCWSRMRDRLLKGASGVLVTHDWSAILKLCETARVIENGTFTFDGPSDRSVVNYLKLPQPLKTGARFSESLSDSHSGYSGKSILLEIPVEILEFGSVNCAVSIEILRIGIGWEIVILSEFLHVGEVPGHYVVSFEINAAPLMPGNYSLNLFLNHAQKNTGDCRSWTYGNGLKLVIDGEPGESSVRLPFEVRRVMKETE